MREESCLLNHISDVPPQCDGIPLHCLAAFDQDFALARIGEAVDQPQRGCLSRPASAQKDERLAAPRRETNVAQKGLAIGQVVSRAAEFDDDLAAGFRVRGVAHGLASFSRNRRMSRSTRSSIASVSLPVNVFCWLGWYDTKRRGKPAPSS